MSYVIFLGLYSYILLVKFNKDVSNEEIILIIWVFSIFAEEVRQVTLETDTISFLWRYSYIYNHKRKWCTFVFSNIGINIAGSRSSWYGEVIIWLAIIDQFSLGKSQIFKKVVFYACIRLAHLSRRIKKAFLIKICSLSVVYINLSHCI